MCRIGKSALSAALLLMLLVAGCSDSSILSPSVDNLMNPALPQAASNSPRVVNNMLWGLWDCSINAQTMEIIVVPIRGAMFTCNVTQFMQPPKSKVNMITLSLGPGSNPQAGYFVVDVRLRHPFPGLNFYNGFDVRGVFMSNGSVVGQHDSSVLRAGEGDSIVLNPDGYTRFWNWGEFTNYNTIFGFTPGKLAPPNTPSCTVNPYKYFADNLELDEPVELHDPASRGIFTAGSVNIRRYDIQFKMNGDKIVFDFQYAVDASWDVPDEAYKPTYPVEAFPMTANCQEAYHLLVTDAGSNAYYEGPAENGGNFIFDLEIFDHQGAVSPSGVPGEISAIWLESEALAAPVDVLGTAVILPGNTIASSVFEVTLGNLNLTHSGDVEFFATIESSNPTTYEPQINGGSNFAYPDTPLAAYFTFNGTVSAQGPDLWIDLTSPDGGESWAVGTDHNITWNPGNVPGTVDLEYSKDGFASDIHTIVDATDNDGSYTWTIPNDPSNTVRVRISATADPSVFDISLADFSIKSAPNWPTTPVQIDPDHMIIGTRFAVDSNGIVHALYSDGATVWWSWSDDYGWNWTNVDTPAFIVPANREIRGDVIAIDSDSQYIYAAFAERDKSGMGTTSYFRGIRLDITNFAAGWSSIEMFSIPGYFIYQNIESVQLAVADDGGIMVFGMRWEPATYTPWYAYSPDWDSLEGATFLDLNNNCENGYETFTYTRYTIGLVADSLGNFYLTLGGRFNDYNSDNGSSDDFGNTIIKYQKSLNRWRFVQTLQHAKSLNYWYNEARGLAIDDNDVLHWVFCYSYDNFSAGPGWPCFYRDGKWFMSYGTGNASGDHDFSYQNPIVTPSGSQYREVLPANAYTCAQHDNSWLHTSIGVTPDGSGVVVAYQNSWNDCSLMCMRNDNGAGWTAPVNIEGPGLDAFSPWGRMHPDGWYLMTFTDYNYKTGGGSQLPYFVAWQ